MTKEIFAIAFSILGCALLISSMSKIDEGQAGVVTLFGKVQENVLSSGIHFLNPLSVVHKMNLKVQTTEATSDAASNDLQKVQTKITLNYSLSRDMAKNIYSSLGVNNEYITESIINPAMSEAFKQATAEYSAESLITKRQIVSRLIQSILQARLEKYGVIVSNISVTDFQFSPAFNTAIEQKMVAQQNVQTAQNRLEQAKVAAKQMLITAQAQADSMKTQQQVLTSELLQKAAIEKWDGKLPQYMGSAAPFINLKLSEQSK